MSTEAKSPRHMSAGDELRSQDKLQYVVMGIASVVTAVFFLALYLAK